MKDSITKSQTKSKKRATATFSCLTATTVASLAGGYHAEFSPNRKCRSHRHDKTRKNLTALASVALSSGNPSRATKDLGSSPRELTVEARLVTPLPALGWSQIDAGEWFRLGMERP